MLTSAIKRLTGTTEEDYMDTLPETGNPAPHFELPVTKGETVTLDQYQGQPVVLVFYPADWSPVCSDQLALYNDLLPEFEKYDAQLLGISVDNVWSHQAYAEDRNLDIPLLADFEPKGAVAKQYGVYSDDYGMAQRALFVLDADGTIHWKHVAEPGVNPGAAGILNALAELAGE